MNVGEFVVHWSGKVCIIREKSRMNLDGTEQDYLVLTSLRDPGEKIYVPEDKKDNVLRPVISEDYAHDLIRRLPEIEPMQVKNERQREQEYKKAFYSQDYEALVQVAKDLYRRRRARTAIGKSLPSRDAQMMEMVEKTFEEEMAVALGVDARSVRGIIENEALQF